MQTFLVSKGES